MITFDEIETHSGKSYAVHGLGRTLGYLHPNEDGFFGFSPNHMTGDWYALIWLKEIVNKLEDLNNPVLQKILSERETEYPPFTD